MNRSNELSECLISCWGPKLRCGNEIYFVIMMLYKIHRISHYPYPVLQCWFRGCLKWTSHFHIFHHSNTSLPCIFCSLQVYKRIFDWFEVDSSLFSHWFFYKIGKKSLVLVRHFDFCHALPVMKQLNDVKSLENWKREIYTTSLLRPRV